MTKKKKGLLQNATVLFGDSRSVQCKKVGVVIGDAYNKQKDIDIMQ